METLIHELPLEGQFRIFTAISDFLMLPNVSVEEFETYFQHRFNEHELLERTCSDFATNNREFKHTFFLVMLKFHETFETLYTEFIDGIELSLQDVEDYKRITELPLKVNASTHIWCVEELTTDKEIVGRLIKTIKGVNNVEIIEEVFDGQPLTFVLVDCSRYYAKEIGSMIQELTVSDFRLTWKNTKSKDSPLGAILERCQFGVEDCIKYKALKITAYLNGKTKQFVVKPTKELQVSNWSRKWKAAFEVGEVTAVDAAIVFSLDGVPAINVAEHRIVTVMHKGKEFKAHSSKLMHDTAFQPFQLVVRENHALTTLINKEEIEEYISFPL